MSDPLPKDPLVCPRCGGPKVPDDILCPACDVVAGEHGPAESGGDAGDEDWNAEGAD